MLIEIKEGLFINPKYVVRVDHSRSKPAENEDVIIYLAGENMELNQIRLNISLRETIDLIERISRAM